MDTIKYFILGHKPQFVFFIIFMAACVPMLIYYRRKNPNPRFRPSAGEMTMVSLLATCVCLGISFGLGSLFNEHQDFKKLAEKPTADYHPGSAGSESTRSKDDGDGKGKKGKNDEEREAILTIMAGQR